jgi:hypothetical protein
MAIHLHICRQLLVAENDDGICLTFTLLFLLQQNELHRDRLFVLPSSKANIIEYVFLNPPPSQFFPRKETAIQFSPVQ